MTSIETFFNKGYQGLPLIDKQNNRHLLNLSSNESQHSDYHLLFEEFIRNYDSSTVTKYPVFRDAHNQACAYHNLNNDQLMLAPGSDFAINLLMNAVGKNMEGLITHSPNYAGYQHYAALQNMPVHLVDRVDRDVLFQFKNMMVAMTNPEGFFGSVMPLSHMLEVVEHCQKQGHLLVIDEAYIEFNNFEHKELLTKFDNVIIVRSYSKGMGLASMRLGVILSTANTIEYLCRFASENSISDISLSYLLFLLARQEKIAEINKNVCSLRAQLIKRIQLTMPDWYVYPSNTNFITISTRSVEEAISIAEVLREKKIRIRRLAETVKHLHCIRITIPSANDINELFDVLCKCYENCKVSEIPSAEL